MVVVKPKKNTTIKVLVFIRNEMDYSVVLSAMYNFGFNISIALVLISIIVSYFFFTNTNTTADTMACNAILFVSNTAKVHIYCQKASRMVQKVLYINVNESSKTTMPLLSRQIVNVYSKTTYNGNVDVRLILNPCKFVKKIITSHPIDLVLYDRELSKEIDNLKQLVTSAEPKCGLQSLDSQEAPLDNVHNEEVKTYEYVAVGGTFDRLHNGHKILLSEAALRATRHVTFGVTDINMIQSKKLWELIEPVEQRIEAVKNFLTDIKPDIEYNVVPIQDLYGPTKDDPRFQMIVVSEETARGAVKINEKRKDNGLSALETYVIGLAEDSHPMRSHEEETKLSSSNQRMRLLGTLLRPPVPNPNIPDWPYVIGLAGGIASGKSSIAEQLKSKGAAIVNCDIIAHELYKPGLPLNSTISETFGQHIITETGEVDRKKLGQIVFSDKAQLQKLNEIVWPAVIEETRRRIKALGEEGHMVVVMEAAVMVRARWYHYCHQLWAVIIPPQEAIKRLQQRNNLSEEEARQRIEAQPSNTEQVALANIVFSPFWSYEYTRGQVDRAWEHLQQFLATRI